MRFTSKLLVCGVSILLLLVGFSKVNAAGTPAGTVIKNWSKMSYTDENGINSYTSFSDTAVVKIQFEGGVVISPDSLYLDGYLQTSVFFSHYVKNIGNGEDNFALDATTLDGWTSEVYPDEDNDGVVDLADTSGAPISQTDTLAADDSTFIFVKVNIPADAEWGEEQRVNFSAMSNKDPEAADTAYEFVTVVGPNIDLSLNASPSSPTEVPPLDTIAYSISAVNSDSSVSRSAWNMHITKPRPEGTSLLDSLVVPSGWDVEYFDGSWSSTFSAEADSIRFSVSDPAVDSLAIGDSAAFQLYVSVNDCITESLLTSISFANYEDAVGPHDYYDTSNTVSTGVIEAGMTLDPDLDTLWGSVNDTVEFACSLTNVGEEKDSFMLDTLLFPDSWNSYKIYEDMNCDGELSSTEISAGVVSSTPSLNSGDKWCFIVRTPIPDTSNDSVRVVATSHTNSCVSETSFFYVQLTEPLITMTMQVDASDTVEREPGDTVTYSISFTNVGSAPADTFTVIDSVDTNTVVDTSSLDMSVVPGSYSWPSDFEIRYMTSGGASWNPWPPADPSDVRVLRIKETSSSLQLQPGDNGEYRFDVIIK